MKDETVYLRHILDCIRRINTYTNTDENDFLASELVQDATLRNLQTMSEATQRLSDQTKSLYSHIPWQQISAFRNILVHNYLGIDMEQVWLIVKRDLPPLHQAVMALLADQTVDDEP